MGGKSRLLGVLRSEGNLPIARQEVKSSEIAGAIKCVDRIINTRERIHIFLCDFVQFAVIDAKTPFSVFLLGQYNWGSPRTNGGTDHAFFKHSLDLGCDFLPFDRRIALWVLANWMCVPCRDTVDRDVGINSTRIDGGAKDTSRRLFSDEINKSLDFGRREAV